MHARRAAPRATTGMGTWSAAVKSKYCRNQLIVGENYLGVVKKTSYPPVSYGAGKTDQNDGRLETVVGIKY